MQRLVKKEFGTRRLVLSSKTSVIALNRPATSLSAIDMKSKNIDLNSVSFFQLDEMDGRYIIARDVTFDLLASLYDINSRSAVLLRATWPLDSGDLGKIKAMIGKLRRPRIEMRVIGLQNGNTNLMKVVDELYNAVKGSLIEVDLFGNLTRHIAIDLNTGMSYDVLLEDRIYRPGELANKIKEEDFKSKQSKVKFK